ncbi:MAG TPA: orotidine-5'-phosphate decarboxylase [Casimicrobiaceae bacterium]|nr:orotidine-5'-phosphate decarboxylase [Casimicrobiaceae bacterium]
MNSPLPRVFVALDFPNAADALALAHRLDPRDCGLKIGKELFVSAGPEPVREMVARGFAVFLDLKFHDIPNTVAGACAAAARLGVAMMNVHASGGRAMLRAARDALDRTAGAGRRPLLIGVTVLTSLSDDDVHEIGFGESAAALARRLAVFAQSCGLDGVVCSAREAPELRAACGPAFKLVTPGIRPAAAATNDQVRIVTPEAALRNGADHLVVGRPVTHAADPVAALAAINASLAKAAA